MLVINISFSLLNILVIRHTCVSQHSSSVELTIHKKCSLELLNNFDQISSSCLRVSTKDRYLLLSVTKRLPPGHKLMASAWHRLPGLSLCCQHAWAFWRQMMPRSHTLSPSTADTDTLCFFVSFPWERSLYFNAFKAWRKTIWYV